MRRGCDGYGTVGGYTARPSISRLATRAIGTSGGGSSESKLCVRAWPEANGELWLPFHWKAAPGCGLHAWAFLLNFAQVCFLMEHVTWLQSGLVVRPALLEACVFVCACSCHARPVFELVAVLAVGRSWTWPPAVVRAAAAEAMKHRKRAERMVVRKLQRQN